MEDLVVQGTFTSAHLADCEEVIEVVPERLSTLFLGAPLECICYGVEHFGLTAAQTAGSCQCILRLSSALPVVDSCLGEVVPIDNLFWCLP